MELQAQAVAPEEVSVDPVTFEVIRHKLTSIVEEQAITLKSVSGSPIVSEACDFNVGLFLADGSMVCTGRQVLYHSGTMPQVIRHVIQDCEEDPGITEGDMFIINNPYKGAVHPPDVSIVAPIFHNGERIGWAGACAHQLDVGGMDFGSWCPRATEIQQECMIIPPVKIVERGKIRKDLWNMIMSMSRLPFIIGLDFKAMIAANNVARERFAYIIARYGAEVVHRVMEGLINLSEERLRRRLRELPDGRFRATNFLDHDGHENRLYKVALTVSKEGDRLTFDLTGTSPQAPGFVNCTESGMIGGLLAGLLPILAFDIPWNEGLLRPVTVVAPSGILCNATWPAPVGSGTCAAVWVVENAAVEAISKMVSCSDTYRREGQAVQDGSFATLNLAGLNQYGEPFGTMLLDPMAGGGGAYSHMDGVDAGGCHCIPAQNIANVETNENFAPILYLYRSFVPDTGGAGKSRGGRSGGLAFVIHDVEGLEGLLVGHGAESPNSQGIFGGYPGSCNVNTLLVGTDIREHFRQGEVVTRTKTLRGEGRDLGAKPGRFALARDDVFEYTWQGGGGYGDPLERQVELVLRDVRSGVVSREWAERLYGVVITPALEVEGEATETLRAEMRRQRASWPQRRRYAAGDGGEGKRLVPVGEFLEVAEVGGMRVIRCTCSHVFCPATENWKEYAATRIISADAAGPLVKLHAELEMREYACPGCGRLQWVEVGKRGEPPLWDLEITL